MCAHAKRCTLAVRRVSASASASSPWSTHCSTISACLHISRVCTVSSPVHAQHSRARECKYTLHIDSLAIYTRMLRAPSEAHSNDVVEPYHCERTSAPTPTGCHDVCNLWVSLCRAVVTVTLAAIAHHCTIAQSTHTHAPQTRKKG